MSPPRIPADPNARGFCISCRFSRRVLRYGSQSCDCHRHAGILVSSGSQASALFPSVDPGEACGDWEPGDLPGYHAWSRGHWGEG